MKRRNYLNTIINKKLFCFIFISVMASGISAAVTVEEDPYPLLFLQRNLSRILVNDNIAPPLAARDYVYPQIAAYFILTLDQPGKKIYQSIRNFPSVDLSLMPKNYPHSLAASYAFFEVAKNMIYTRQPFIDSFAVLKDWYKEKGMDAASFESARQAGERIASAIVDWMNEDQFEETRRMNKYVLLKTPGKWQITPPGYFPAVEPHWGEIRTMFMQKPFSEILLPVPFDTAANSGFYKEASNVYSTGVHLTEDQKLIASFWDCNPFALHPTGHINSIVKKISPGGHWMSIAGIACRSRQFNLEKTSEAYTLCAITLFDAFIYTWDIKYRYNYLRPETYIEQTGIDAGWQPYIQSPPFPEFPSGHAVISNAAAVVLTSIFGSDFVFTDNTETEFGLDERTFHSFQQAADEATISRVYGGIHFLFSCEIGQEMGKRIAKNILDKLSDQ